jgi:hypothetical protein
MFNVPLNNLPSKPNITWDADFEGFIPTNLI